jgi:hypothetical protein
MSSTAQYLQGISPAYTFVIFQSSADEWQFNLRTIDSPDLAQSSSATAYPSIQRITYNFVNNTIIGDCTSPSSNNTTFPQCVTGSFNAGDFLSFDLIDLRANTTTNLRAIDKEWTFNGDDAPNVLLRDQDGVEMLKTDVTKQGDCTQLKVCAAKEAGPELIVPVGLLLMHQMDHATRCT